LSINELYTRETYEGYFQTFLKNSSYQAGKEDVSSALLSIETASQNRLRK